MIFYFSGTGNSAWAARHLASLTGDEAYDITNLNKLPDMEEVKQIGFFFPVYAWGMPEIMVNFVKKLPKASGIHLRCLHLRWRCRTGHEAVFQTVPSGQ